MNDLKFTSTHEWIKQEGNEMTMGISDHAQALLGDMVYVELPKLGDSFAAGDELAVVESVKAASDVYAPISGEVIAVNEALLEKPELVNQSPYTAGWLVKIKAHDLSELDKLLDEAAYQKEIAQG